MSRRRRQLPAAAYPISYEAIRVICTDRGHHRRRLITHLKLLTENDGRLPWVIDLGPAPDLGIGAEASFAETFQTDVSGGSRPTRRRFTFECFDPTGRCRRHEELREEHLVRVLAAAYKIHLESARPYGNGIEWDISHHELIQYSKP